MQNKPKKQLPSNYTKHHCPYCNKQWDMPKMTGPFIMACIGHQKEALVNRINFLNNTIITMQNTIVFYTEEMKENRKKLQKLGAHK